jgi:MFS family permease
MPLQVLANLLALAAICPFVGSLSDLMGRRYVALIGAALIVIGMIVCSTAQTMNIFICTLDSPLAATEGTLANPYGAKAAWLSPAWVPESTNSLLWQPPPRWRLPASGALT